MNWMVITWIVMASACLTLGSIHLVIWTRQRNDTAQLSFSLAAFSIACVGVFELLLMQADTPQHYAALIRWTHVPVALLAIALVAFVRLHLRAGRAWLGNLAWGLRVLALIPNFTTGVNQNFQDITGLMELQTWGGARYVTPVGTASSWTLLGQASNLLMMAFFIDAALSAWRDRSNPMRAKVMRICGSMALFVLLAGFWHLAIVIGHVPLPVAVLPAFTGVILVMSYELGSDVLRAAHMAKALTASELTLWKSERRIEEAVAAAGFGLWECDLHTEKFWLSPQARLLLGMEGNQDVYRSELRDFIDPADFDVLNANMQAALVEGAEYLSEFRVLPSEGRRRWLLARGRADFDGQGNPTLLRGVIIDITERKQAAMQRDELAHLSRVALLSELSGSLAHELNQPLTSILINAQAAQHFMAHDPPDWAEINQILAEIIASDKRAGEVISRLRSLLRKEPSDFRRIDLNEAVQDVLRIIRSDLLNKNVEVRLELAPDLPPLHGDWVQLQQVLLNLIVNGCDAMQHASGERELTIRTRAVRQVGVELTVSDCGTGIPPADLERIFTPFVTSKAEGMGLGLAVCTTIVDAHRGRLWASNNEQVGATLHLQLPTPDA